MTRERIEDMREVVLPFVKKRLLETNYENLGESDAEEFAREFNEILDLAIKALEQLEQEPVIELKVGDEVTVEGINGVVVREPYPIGSDNEMFVLIWYGQCMSSNSIKNVVPTGRHFSQITDVLEQLTARQKV